MSICRRAAHSLLVSNDVKEYVCSKIDKLHKTLMRHAYTWYCDTYDGNCMGIRYRTGSHYCILLNIPFLFVYNVL